MGFIIIAINPQSSLNPFPPATSVIATPSPTAASATLCPPTVAFSAVATPSVRPTPTRMDLDLPTPTATPTFPFTSTVEVRARPDCEEIVLAGTVRDAEGEPLEGYPVHLWGPTGEAILISGSSPDYGAGGWAFALPRAKVPSLSTWFVQLHEQSVYRSHPSMSSIVEVRLSGDCEEGLTLIHFHERADLLGGVP